MKIEIIGGDWSRFTVYSQEDLDNLRFFLASVSKYAFPDEAQVMSFMVKSGKIEQVVMMPKLEGQL